jgi:hypothetical protein
VPGGEPALDDEQSRLAAVDADLASAHAKAQLRVDRATVAEQSAARLLRESTANPTWRFIAASTARVAAPNVSTRQWGLIAGISVAAGLCVGVAVHGLRPVFESVAAAEAALDAPILGVIPAASDAPPRRIPRDRLWGTRVVRATETLLVALVLAATLHAWLDHDFALRLAENPLDAFAGWAGWVRS